MIFINPQNLVHVKGRFTIKKAFFDLSTSVIVITISNANILCPYIKPRERKQYLLNADPPTPMSPPDPDRKRYWQISLAY